MFKKPHNLRVLFLEFLYFVEQSNLSIPILLAGENGEKYLLFVRQNKINLQVNKLTLFICLVWIFDIYMFSLKSL